MPLVAVLVVLGASWLSAPTYVAIVTVVVVAQVSLLACPVLALTGWLKRRHEPTFANHWSFTVWLYRTHGPKAGTAVSASFTAFAIGVRYAFF